MASRVCLCFCALFGMTMALRPRGVRPDMGSFYDPNASFFCLDGSAEIPFDQVNDDYCDCNDGSDEPGTSACSNGMFYCANRGYHPSLNPSSRVNDGICDCCDGSDEWAMVAGSPCVNTCAEAGAAEKAERERLEKVIEEGLKVKAEMEKQGVQMRLEKQNLININQAQLEKLIAELEANKEILDQAETAEREALDANHEQEEQKRKELEEKERNEQNVEASEFFQKCDTNQDGVVSRDELQAFIDFDQNNDGQVSEEEAQFYHDSYNQDTFISSGWLVIKRRLSKVEPMQEVNLEAISGQEHEEKAVEASKKYSPEIQALVDAADNARTTYEATNKAYNDLDNDIQELEKYLENDFGPNEVFAPLNGQCFELNDPDYTYKLCLFDKTSQRPLSGGSETKLGSWEKWSQPHIQMSYEQGAKCWNGPQRSAKVDLKCGADNKLLSSSEPSKCEYLFIFETPAACQPLEPMVHDEL